jgi:uncharacterized protein YkwD
MLARAPVAEHSDRVAARLGGPEWGSTTRLRRGRPYVSCFCKDACTLFWGAQASGRDVGAVLICALSILLATMLLMPACVLAAARTGGVLGGVPATSAKRRAASCAYANLRPTYANTARVDAATLCLIDRVRAAFRLLPLRSNRELQSVASAQSTGMVSKDYFEDANPSGQSPAALIGTLPYGADAASLSTAQDLGWGTTSDATPAAMVMAWMRSPAHREIILTAIFRDAGVGVTAAVPTVLGRGKHGATYAVEFGART